MASKTVAVEVAYATASQQTVIALAVSPEFTVEQAIHASGILQRHPELDLSQHKIGIFSQLCQLQHTVTDGDRIEIYRPLQQDPMTARRNRLHNRPKA